MMKPSSICTATILSFFLLPVAGAQTASEDDEPFGGFGEVVDVQVVNVEVFVTDKEGAPVTGLQAEDFEVFENRKRMAITNFYAVEGRKVRPESSLSSAGDVVPPEDADLELPTLEVPEEQRLHLVLYIDNGNIHPRNRNRFFAYLRRFVLSTLGKEDQVALYTFEQTLNLREPFSHDKLKVLDYLDELEDDSGYRMGLESERHDLRLMIDRAQERFGADARVRMFAENLRIRTENAIDGVGRLIEGLAGLEGRKAVMYVSDGLPMRMGEDLFYTIGDKFNDPSAITEAFQFDLSGEFQELADKANANEVTFYTVDAAGLRAFSTGTADQRSARSTIRADTVRAKNYHSPLRLMARETGGQAIIGTSNFSGGLEKVSMDFKSYYSLGYTPTHGGDGRKYDIEVRTKNKDWKVRHRRGYRAKTRQTQMSEGTIASLAFGAGKNPLDLVVDFGALTPAEGRQYMVPVVVRVPIRKVVLVPREEVFVGRLKLYFAVMDGRGNMTSVEEKNWAMEIPADRFDEAQAQTYAYELQLLMKSGRQRIAVGVHDQVGATSSFVTSVLNVGRVDRGEERNGR